MITLVLLPGMDGTGLLFADFVSALGPEFETHIVSYPADSSLGYAELEAIARSFLPQGRPFMILAESFSGPLAISIAASTPPGLIGLVLCCSFSRNPRPLLTRFGMLLKLLPARLLPTAFGSRCLLGRFSSARLRSALHQSLARVSPSILGARVKAVATVDVSAKLGLLRIPFLYLRATNDFLVTRAASEHILEMAPHMQVAELEGPHLLLQAMPSVAAATVSEFARNAVAAWNVANMPQTRDGIL